MKNRIKSILGAVVSSATLLTARVSMAATPFQPQNTGLATGGESDLTNTINSGLSFALYAAGLVAIVYILIGGFSYVTSSGNAEKVGTANKTIAYAIVGLIIVALAFAIKSFVISRLLGNTTASGV